MEDVQRPLEGLLVLDLGHIYQAPYCGFLMAMAGARTIAQVSRIVEPGGIDPESVITPGIFVQGVVEVANNDALAFGLAINDLAPRVDQHTIAVRFASVFVLAALRHGQYIALVLNGAGAQQHFPMRPPGRLGKSGRDNM